MKKLKRTLLIVISILLVLIISVGTMGYITFADLINGASSVKKLEDGLYYMEYKGDYGFEEFLAQGGAESEDELADYLITFMSKGMWKPETEDVSLDFGCSALTKDTTEGTVMGRNFDWEGETGNVMIIHTIPDKGYESYSTTWLNFLGFGEGFTPESFADKYMATAATYVPLDGINEKGLCVADLLAGDEVTTNQQTEKTDLTTTSAIRLMLDNASDVDEAVKLLEKYDMHSSTGTSHHFAISDAQGKSVVVEYIDNKMVVTETKAVTNHYLSQGEKYGIGNDMSHQRFDALLTMEKGIKNTSDMMNTMKNVSYQNITQWSIVYNLDAKTLEFYYDRNFDNAHSFKIN